MEVLAPVLIPITYIALALVLRSKLLKQTLAVIFSVLNFLMALYLIILAGREDILVSNIGSWPAPYGITMVADRFSALMLLVSSIVFLATTVYAIQAIDAKRKENGYF
jgi:multicomponent Na+:H+ antiporter subunit D